MSKEPLMTDEQVYQEICTMLDADHIFSDKKDNEK